ncbi:probable cytochrome P450 6d5 [Stomoxys calcitrans]|uniref:probable cytochrome P450 6d5 n=1 Tax=Stomoxys calcitrans TaxID=35570 RepID=UPI0027E22591|nr:probable cytochrome P450 6d5 [Stomoxys calcitrans]
MFLYLIIIVCTAIVLYFKWCYSYWHNRGFPYVKAKTPYGALDSVIRTWKQSVGIAMYDIYAATPQHKMVGIYLLNRPALMVRDAHLARNILTRDFNSFHDRGIYVDEIHDPMSGGLYFLKGQQWKSMRSKLAPSFTSGKLRGMFGLIDEVSHRMVDYMKTTLPEDGTYKTVEAKHVFVTYGIDIIASSIFGLDVNSFKDNQNEFFALSKNVNENSYRGKLRITCQYMYPSLEKFFQRLGWREPAPEYMKKLVRRTIEHRDKHNIVRKDMLQLLLQLRNTGKINDDNDLEWAAKKTKDDLAAISMELIAAQLFIFYVAGFETSSATIAFTLYELSQYPELLQKAQEDVKQAYEKHGSLSYDAITDMKFLDLCFMETARKYPGLPVLNRECTEDYTIPDTDLVIKKGTPIIISLFGIHRDEKYFPNALGYDPERYLNKNYEEAAFMPFGEGPRHCIAQRMGRLIVKVALAHVLTNFNIKINENPVEIEFDNFGIPIMPKGGVPLLLSRKTETMKI